MATVTGIRLVKKFTYRGDATETFSNEYFFKGPPPVDDAGWNTLHWAVWTEEAKIFPNTVFLQHAYGYNDNNPDAHHVFSIGYEDSANPPPGTMAIPAAGTHMAGDQAACVEWKLDRLSRKGKPVYLRKYLHAGFAMGSNADELDPSYRTLLSEYAVEMNNAAIHGGLRSRMTDDNVTTWRVIPYTTTRTLHRRGKRPVPKA